MKVKKGERMALGRYLLIISVLFSFLLGVEKNRTIKVVSTTNWEPFNLRENGRLDGISVDYWRIVVKKLNLNSDYHIVRNWNDVLKAIKEKRADITLSSGKTKDRESYAIFSKPYASFPIVFATKTDVGFIPNINFLKGKVIAVGKNYTSAKLIKEKYPFLTLLEVENVDKALKLLNEKRVYAVADILPVLVYKISKDGYFNIKISGKSDIQFDMRFMLRKDLSDLLEEINRVIDSISIDEQNRIYSKWIDVEYQKGVSEREVNFIMITFLFLIVVFLIWIWLLRREIRKRKIVEEQLKKIAMFDRLTGIYNRYKLDMVLEQQVQIAERYKRPLSLIFMDIDKFKSINDTYGHEMGDLVLKKFADIVRNNIRKSDIFGRWGGEEFILILPETKLSEAIKLAKKLRELVEEHNFDKRLKRKITSSFGVVQYREGESIKTMLHRVDELLYKAKENGRNRVEFDFDYYNKLKEEGLI